jgi:AraC-like DNA-binding protein
MMTYTKYKPSPSLSPFVVCYFIWERDTEEELLVQSPPTGFTALVFNYADPYWAYQSNTQKEEVPLTFASGQFTANYHLEIKGKVGVIGVVLNASSLYNLLGLNMASLINKRLDLVNLLGEKAKELLLMVKMSTDAEAKIKIMEDFLSCFLEKAKSRLSIIDDTIDFIDQKNGMVSMEEVLSKFKFSRRYLEKKFLEKVGISPKLYARIRRFSYLSNKVAHIKEINWQDIVFENGYHDQSHLVKDYRTFNQMKPSEYHQGHHELIRYIKNE